MPGQPGPGLDRAFDELQERDIPNLSLEPPPMSRTIDIADAKAQFSDLVAQAETGAEIVIVRNGVPVARIAPLNRPVAETVALLRAERARRPRVSAAEIRAAREQGRA